MAAPLEVRLQERKAAKELQCPICLGILNTPKQCKNGHLFCDACIRSSQVGKCPICRCQVGEKDLGRNLLAEEYLNSVPVWCQHRFKKSGTEWVVDESGCPKAFPNAEIAKHEVVCEYAWTSCSFSKECHSLRKKDQTEHNKICPFRPVECEFCRLNIESRKYEEHKQTCGSAPLQCSHCGSQVKREALNFHHGKDCQEYIIECPYGCGKKLKRKDISSHLREDATAHFEGFRLLTAKKLQEQETKHQTAIHELKKKVASLERRMSLATDFKVCWTIRNWHQACLSGYTESKIFEYKGLEWHLGMYTQAKEPEGEFISLFLFFGTNNVVNKQQERSIKVFFRLTIVNHESIENSCLKEFHTTFPTITQGSGDRQFLPCKALNQGFISNSNSVVVELEIGTDNVTWKI